MSRHIAVCCESREKAGPYLAALVGLGVSEEDLLLITPGDSPDGLAALAARSAGVVLCGGPDLDPRYYGEPPREDARLSIRPELDRLDWELLHGARSGRTPVWAICRGMQIVNVFQGGTLWQDIPSQLDGVLEHDPDGPDDAMAHEVRTVCRRDGFAEVLDGGRIQVNSRHHQAVKGLGKDLSIVGESPDGLAEVLSLDDSDWWVRGVQWHPENLLHVAAQRMLWLQFLERARQRMTSAEARPAFRSRGDR